jgi:hypothetical protein
MALAAALWAAVLPATAWEGDTIRVGGPGGAQDRDLCGSGEAMVGLTYKAGKDLNVVWMTCAATQGGLATGRPSDRGAWGTGADNGHGMRGGNVGCPAPMVVQAIYATMGAKVVHDFWLLCRNLTTGEHFQAPWSQTMGGQGGRAGNANCGDDGYATGMLISYGSMVDAIGLVCTIYRPAPAPKPADKPIRGIGKPKPPPPQGPKGAPLKVDNGDSGQTAAGDGGGGRGAGASAATDTTVYDEPAGNEIAYLSAGDPVSGVSCNDDNWCRISKPEKGWVWGDDLNR